MTADLKIEVNLFLSQQQFELYMFVFYYLVRVKLMSQPIKSMFFSDGAALTLSRKSFSLDERFLM
jgi:hypothetical protein